MKSSRPNAPAHDAFVELTAETITDDMILSMLRHARTHRDPDTAVMCCKALRPLATITTTAETATRQAAREECASQINERVRSWLDRGCSDYRWYASLVGLGPSARHKPRGPWSRAGGRVAHPLCWECNCPFEPDDDRRIVTLRDRGRVSVHLSCIDSIDDAELDEVERLAVKAAAAEPLPPRPDEPLLGPWGCLEDTIDSPEDDR